MLTALWAVRHLLHRYQGPVCQQICNDVLLSMVSSISLWQCFPTCIFSLLASNPFQHHSSRRMALLITAGFDDACYLSCKVSLWFLAIGHWFVYKSRMLSTFFSTAGRKHKSTLLRHFCEQGFGWRRENTYDVTRLPFLLHLASFVLLASLRSGLVSPQAVDKVVGGHDGFPSVR